MYTLVLSSVALVCHGFHNMLHGKLQSYPDAPLHRRQLNDFLQGEYLYVSQ